MGCRMAILEQELHYLTANHELCLIGELDIVVLKGTSGHWLPRPKLCTASKQLRPNIATSWQCFRSTILSKLLCSILHLRSWNIQAFRDFTIIISWSVEVNDLLPHVDTEFLCLHHHGFNVWMRRHDSSCTTLGWIEFSKMNLGIE